MFVELEFHSTKGGNYTEKIYVNANEIKSFAKKMPPQPAVLSVITFRGNEVLDCLTPVENILEQLRA